MCGFYFVAQMIRYMVEVASAHADGDTFEFHAERRQYFPLGTRILQFLGLPTRPGIDRRDFRVNHGQLDL